MAEISTEEYDLIGYRIVSPFHLVALAAFAQNFKPDKDLIKILVIVSQGPWKKNILAETSNPDPRLKMTFITEDEAELEFPVWWPLLLVLRPFAGFRSRWANSCRIPVCAPTLACLRYSCRSISTLRHFYPVLIDEGLGSFNTRENCRREAKNKFRMKWIQTLVSYGFLFCHIALPLLGGRRVALFGFDGDKPVLNSSVAESYRRVFRMGYSSRCQSVKFDQPIVLLLTQPFAEMGICSSDGLVDEVGNLIQKVKQLGLTPMLKIHPAENASKYSGLNVMQVNYEGPAEEIFAASADNIVEVWGFTSTSLIMGNALYGIPSRTARLPWPESTTDTFKDQSQLLFQTYTEPL